jgi:hypothetical protein
MFKKIFVTFIIVSAVNNFSMAGGFFSGEVTARHIEGTTYELTGSLWYLLIYPFPEKELKVNILTSSRTKIASVTLLKVSSDTVYSSTTGVATFVRDVYSGLYKFPSLPFLGSQRYILEINQQWLLEDGSVPTSPSPVPLRVKTELLVSEIFSKNTPPLSKSSSPMFEYRSNFFPDEGISFQVDDFDPDADSVTFSFKKLNAYSYAYSFFPDEFSLSESGRIHLSKDAALILNPRRSGIYALIYFIVDVSEWRRYKDEMILLSRKERIMRVGLQIRNN